MTQRSHKVDLSSQIDLLSPGFRWVAVGFLLGSLWVPEYFRCAELRIFQRLEKREGDFPTVGNMAPEFSNGWKSGAQELQRLESAQGGRNLRWQRTDFRLLHVPLFPTFVEWSCVRGSVTKGVNGMNETLNIEVLRETVLALRCIRSGHVDAVIGVMQVPPVYDGVTNVGIGQSVLPSYKVDLPDNLISAIIADLEKVVSLDGVDARFGGHPISFLVGSWKSLGRHE